MILTSRSTHLLLAWLCLILFQPGAASLAAPSPASARPQVQLGIDVLAANGYNLLKGKRVGLLTNPSGRDSRGVSTIEHLRRAPGVRLVALFSAEHGIDGNRLAGEEIPDGVHAATGLPVFSLYGPGPTRKPTARMLQGLDVVVYDIQDTGARSYTYISTMGLAMEACAEAGVEFLVLDRPNPLGGERVEGPPLDPRFKSLVSQWPIPYLYGMTSGELARMIAGEGWIKTGCKLTVVPMRGWKRTMVWKDTALPWVPTSPNIPRHDSPLYYASTGIFGTIAGGSGLTIGMGFKLPFEFVAANWIDPHQLSRQLSRYKLKGVSFPVREVQHDNRVVRGVRPEFHSPSRAPLVAINFYLNEAVRKVSGRDLYAESTRIGKDFSLFDKIVGGTAIRKDIANGRGAAQIVSSWKPFEDQFRARRKKYLIYS